MSSIAPPSRRGDQYIFFSYENNAQAPSQLLYDSLYAWGFSLWRDVHDIVGGEDWVEALVRAVDGSGALVIALSERQSFYQGFEVGIGENLKRKIFPVRLPGATPISDLPATLTRRHVRSVEDPIDALSLLNSQLIEDLHRLFIPPSAMGALNDLSNIVAGGAQLTRQATYKTNPAILHKQYPEINKSAEPAARVHQALARQAWGGLKRMSADQRARWALCTRYVDFLVDAADHEFEPLLRACVANARQGGASDLAILRTYCMTVPPSLLREHARPVKSNAGRRGVKR